MSAARMGRKWADVDEEDDEQVDTPSGKSGARFETAADKDGIKTVIEYKEKGLQTYKVTRKVKVTVVTKRTSQASIERKGMRKFGKSAANEENADADAAVRSVEEVPIELTRRPGAPQLGAKDDVEDKWLEESLAITENLFKEKKLWSSMNKDRQEDRDSKDAAAAAPASTDDKKPADVNAPVAAPSLGNKTPSAYVPPSLRGKGTDGKGGGKGDSMQQQQEASLRITNLSEDVKEGDLQDLFGQCGRLQRVYLAKDMQTFQSKGFAFITYYTREDAEKAIQKLNGHGYDNLILQVNWAKPRA